MQMAREWMYGTDRRSGEFMNGLREFLRVADANKRNVLYSVRVVTVRIRRITQTQKSFTSTCFGMVSCPAIIVGPSTERGGL
jgi:hypothetical protein